MTNVQPVQTILIVDDVAVNRIILAKILSADYKTKFAENGTEALKVLSEDPAAITAVILDLAMPVMNGYEFLQEISGREKLKNLPVIVTTGSSDRDSERAALKLGAWDFVTKPYDPEIIRFRVHNVILRSQMSAFSQLKYLAEYDRLTGIYNKEKFFAEAREIIERNPNTRFDIVRMDIDRFQLINSFFGIDEGDRLLKYVAEKLSESVREHEPSVCGRMEADIFAVCLPHLSEEEHRAFASRFQAVLQSYELGFDMVPFFGVFRTENASASVDQMYDYANLAAKTIKGSYVELCAFYNQQMSMALEKEQEITNEMNAALIQEQFVVYLQPKYNLHSNMPAGAEALVRWLHPDKGLVSPGVFVPVFERNGFISKLDYYMWEKVCKLLRGWLDQGFSPAPVSVNVSRVNLYNARLVEMICELTDRYRVPHGLLNLELTESAYTDNPHAMKETLKRLHEQGFVVLMDDFGSGYSSLNILKDIPVDIIKIDMRFFSQSEIPGRGENIIAAVMRMAKWLNIPTIAEGVEREEQVEFLRGIGCEYVQGYYFARPMPVDEYEKLVRRGEPFRPEQKENSFNPDSLWAFTPQTAALFSNVMQAVAIYECSQDHVELLRVNQAYYDLLGYEDVAKRSSDALSTLDADSQQTALGAFRAACRDGQAECDVLRRNGGETRQWIHLRLKYISEVGGKAVLLGSLTDSTAQKEADLELQRFKHALSTETDEHNRLLIVDDVRVNRIVLQTIFADRFEIIEAENGREAIDKLRECRYQVDLVLLDLNMPVMDGTAFLKYKKDHSEIADIPVIIITADETPQQQANTLALGANDYIVKPFVQEVVLRRVSNVLESNRRFRDMLREYNSIVELSQSDPLTRIYNRAATEERVEHLLARSENGARNALVMLDIDHFKEINDQFGHDSGDAVLVALADKLKRYFRMDDIVGRFGGDEFCVFLPAISAASFVLGRCQMLCREIAGMSISPKRIHIGISIGIAFSQANTVDFATLYKHADLALYESKRRGRNCASVYGEETAVPAMDQWINKDWLVDELEDAVFIFDSETYDVLYASRAALSLCGVECYGGQKCYGMLQGLTEPCPNCNRTSLESSVFHKRQSFNKHLQRPLLVRDKLIRYMDRQAQLKIVTDLSRMTDERDKEDAKS